MNALQKRLAQIGTEPHENGLCDGIVFEDSYNRHYWIFNHYSFYEWLRHYMVHYAGFTWEQATERLAQTRWNEPPETEDELGYTMHELTYDLAMEIAKEDKLWQDRTSSDSGYSIKEKYSWYEEIKEKYHLNEEYEILSFKEAEIPMNGQKRYFLNCSDLHKKATDQPTYLYDEITQKEAEEHSQERAYYIGYFKGEQLVRYEKIYQGKVLMDKTISD